MSEISAKRCFVIAPIGEENSDTRRRSDQVLRHIITPAANSCGYEVIRADGIADPGVITSQVLQHIMNDELVVADLTGHNPNVFYELAVRHAWSKPFVQLIEADEIIPFDIANVRTVPVNHHDLDSVDKCKRDLVEQIRALEASDGPVDTPISIAMDLQQLRHSTNPLEKSNVAILEELAVIRQMLGSIAAQLPVPHAQKCEEYFYSAVGKLDVAGYIYNPNDKVMGRVDSNGYVYDNEGNFVGKVRRRWHKDRPPT
jgi:hypothetical protein